MEIDPRSHLGFGELGAGITILYENGFSAVPMHSIYETAAALCPAVKIQQRKRKLKLTDF